MKKLINDPADVVAEALLGIEAAHPDLRVDHPNKIVYRADAPVVSHGVDPAAGDPESPLEVTGRGFAEAGRSLAALGLPTVFVQEGGYDLDTLGDLVLAVLDGFEEARDC